MVQCEEGYINVVVITRIFKNGPSGNHICSAVRVEKAVKMFT